MLGDGTDGHKCPKMSYTSSSPSLAPGLLNDTQTVKCEKLKINQKNLFILRH